MKGELGFTGAENCREALRTGWSMKDDDLLEGEEKWEGSGWGR